jgi:uncharacterized protein YjbJ (UPF0337 family)
VPTAICSPSTKQVPSSGACFFCPDVAPVKSWERTSARPPGKLLGFGFHPIAPLQISPYIFASTILSPLKKMKPSTHDQVAGTTKSLAGKVKEATGKLVGNPRLEAAGKAKQVEGQVQKKIGEIEKVFGS